jgi:1-acyl-sn-glycerol-3-phosphate acyltransferase
MQRQVVLVDANNVRGTQLFPQLPAFCSAVLRWAPSDALVMVMVDHGERAEAFVLSKSLVVAFSGLDDADTAIVHAVDWLLSDGDAAEVRVVTSDALLRTRCTHGLAEGTAPWSSSYGAKRGRAQLARLSFVGSAAFGQQLSIRPVPADADVFAAELRPEAAAAVAVSSAVADPPSRAARRRAKLARQRAEARQYAPSERTADREKAAAELHRRLAARCPISSRSTRRGAAPSSLAELYARWFATESALTSSDEGRAEAQQRALPLEALCSYTRLRPGVGWLGRAALALWAPAGVLLVLARLLAVLCAALAFTLGARLAPGGTPAPRLCAAVLRVLCALLGLRVRLVSGRADELREASVIVANHVSQLDAVPFRLASPCTTLLRETYGPHAPRPSGRIARFLALLPRLFLPPILNACFSPIYVPTPEAAGDEGERARRERVRHAAAAATACGRPLLLFPEGSITNGRAGLMRFAQFAFSLEGAVRPVALRLRTALPLEADTVFAPLPINLLWSFFQPWQTFEVSVLPALARRVELGESAAEFAARAARCIAMSLGQEATPHCSADKAVHLRAVKAVGQAAWLDSCRRTSQPQPATLR